MGQRVYRYILADVPSETPICNCWLVTARLIANQDWAIRISVTENMKLERDIAGYYQTESESPLKKFKPVVMVKINNVWTADKLLTAQWLNNALQPHEFYNELDKRGYRSVKKFGFITHKQLSYLYRNHKTAQTSVRLPRDEELNNTERSC